MAGLDKQILDKIDHKSVIEHVKSDIASDLIIAPHYSVIFRKAGDDLWSLLRELLNSGSYNPVLPHTLNVPKKNWFARLGSILNPLDRFLYQALADNVSHTLEHALDRDRCFSNVVSENPEKMFEPGNECYSRFQKKIRELCDEGTHILRTDISNCFETIPHHHLINLMNETGCLGEIVNLLEKMLSAFREKNSFGIIQGLYPSDLLGNFFLSDIDSFFELQEIPSARYIDDIYLLFESELAAKKGLFNLTERVRKNGLHLNESKTRILPSEEAIWEETAIDRLFKEAKGEVIDEIESEINFRYAFDDWEIDTFDDGEIYDEPEREDSLETTAVEHLFRQIGNEPRYDDGIEKFCLPFLKSVFSDIAVDYVRTNILEKPHQTRWYFSYLSTFIDQDPDLVKFLENLLSSEKLISSYQKMFLLATLFKAPRIRRQKINIALNWLDNGQEAEEVRALAAILAARHGNPSQKRTVRLKYQDEQSEYVRSAILHASRFFTSADKKTCKRTWGSLNMINTLIAKTI